MAPDADDADELLSYGAPPAPAPRGHTSRAGNKAENVKTLLAFYRQRCDAFQHERRVMLEQLGHVDVSKEELHRAKWELKTRKQEMVELETSLKAANATIFQLKEEKLALETQNEALRIQEQDDRRKIQHLLALTQPVTEEVMFFRDCRPDAVASYPPPPPGPMTYPYPSTMHVGSEEMLTSRRKLQREAARGTATIRRNSSANSAKRNPSGASTQAAAAKQSTTNQILRTIYMPNDQADTLTRSITNLQQQVSKQQQLHDERVQHLLDQFVEEKLKLQQEARRFEEANQLLEKRATKAQRLLEKTTKDYLVLRHQSQESERTAQEELLKVTEKCEELAKEKASATTEALAAADATKEKAYEETTQYTQQLREQAVARERDLHILQEQYAAVQEACAKRIQDLQTRLTKLRARYRSLDQRRSMEMEGFTRDIAAIKRNMQRLETTLYGRRVIARQEHKPVSSRGTRNRNEIFESTDLSNEIAVLQQRMAELAADVDDSHSL